jgi:hypothetical protein
VPEYVTTTFELVESCVAFPLVNVKGQFTPPWPTRPFALQSSVEPDKVPVPEPLTPMLPPHVAAKDTFAAVELTGVTVYFTLPQPVAGVDAVADDHVPANTSMLTLGADGDVGVEPDAESLLPSSRLQPADNAHASAIAAGKRIREFRMVPPTQGAGVTAPRGNRASIALSAAGG